MSKAGKHRSQALSRAEHLGNGMPTVDSESKTAIGTGLQNSEATERQRIHKQDTGGRVFPVPTSGAKACSPKPYPSPSRISF